MADLVAVAELIADIERIEGKPVEWGGGKQSDGSTQMPFVVYPPEAQRLIRAISVHNLIVNFDWPAWQDEAQRFVDPEVVRAASLDEVRKLLTLHVRQDRFDEGHFVDMIASGHISAVLRRLRELVRDAAGPHRNKS